MNKNITDQVLSYWDRSALDFDAIYTGAKPLWSRLLDKWLRRDMYQRFDWIFQHSGDVRGKSVCDLGCGSGRYILDYGYRDARQVVGIDGAHSMAVQASANIMKAGLADRCLVREQTILEINSGEVFDITLAVGVFDYISDPLPYLRTIRKISSGHFLSTWPRFWTYRMPIRRVRLAFRGCPVYFFKKDQIRSLLCESGFVPERIDVVGALFCVLASPAREADEETSE